MGRYGKKWGPKDATMSKDSIHRIDRAIEKRQRQESKNIVREEEKEYEDSDRVRQQ